MVLFEPTRLESRRSPFPTSWNPIAAFLGSVSKPGGAGCLTPKARSSGGESGGRGVWVSVKDRGGKHMGVQEIRRTPLLEGRSLPVGDKGPVSGRGGAVGLEGGARGLAELADCATGLHFAAWIHKG